MEHLKVGDAVLYDPTWKAGDGRPPRLIVPGRILDLNEMTGQVFVRATMRGTSCPDAWILDRAVISTRLPRAGIRRDRVRGETDEAAREREAEWKHDGRKEGDFDGTE